MGGTNASKEEMKKNEISIAEIKTDLSYIKADVKDIKTEIRSLQSGFVTRAEFQEAKSDAEKEHGNFVTKSEFDPYKRGLVAIAGAVLLAIVNSVLELIRLR